MFSKRMIIAIIITLVLVFAAVYLAFTGKLNKNYIPQDIKEKMRPITLRYWRVYDEQENFEPIFNAYKTKHPNITVEYRKLRYEEYEQALLEAIAIGKGPDIFSIHNTWTRKYQTKGLLTPMPKETKMVFPYLSNGLKKEMVYEMKVSKMLTPKQLKNAFVDTVYDDVVIPVKNEATKAIEEMIYALPLGMDTLVMYYNRDLFNNAGIANPPEFWNKEFQQDVKKLTKQDNKGEIIQSGVSLGGTDNIERPSDILSTLMMQSGANMMADGRVAFNLSSQSLQDFNPGLAALIFYSDFANPAKEVYSWNERLDNSLDLFIAGKLAMMFGYSYMEPIIKTRAPGLNYEIVKLPQIQGNVKNVNFANYWVETVSIGSKYKEEAWDFLSFLASKDQVKTYLKSVKKPTVLRSYIGEQLEDEELKLYVDQVLTAKSWYHGSNALVVEDIFKKMIKQAVAGQRDLLEILNSAAQMVQQTIEEK